ncbi:crooked neck-like protein [Ramicandelaber brevisporus]|nr:crooked neck-like protein [Ramicandelaber brevisporus]
MNDSSSSAVYQTRNRAPAPVQITAEQLVADVAAHNQRPVPRKPAIVIQNEGELASYRLRERTKFEDNIRRRRDNISNWIRYALWEEAQADLRRARSVFERAVESDPYNVQLYNKYLDFEVRNGNVNLARNLYDKVTVILPLETQFWLGYVQMEERLRNVDGVRSIFERWIRTMQSQVPMAGWDAYIDFEQHYGNIESVRSLFDRLTMLKPDYEQCWINWANYEMSRVGGGIDESRRVFERAIHTLGDERVSGHLYIAFAKLEIKEKETDRARAIYEHAVDTLAKQSKQSDLESVREQYAQFKQQFGRVAEIEEQVLGRRRDYYTKTLKDQPANYDTWMDYARLEESAKEVDFDRVRNVYSEAVKHMPSSSVKDSSWRKYIFLWLNWAVFEELTVKDITRTRQVYQSCLRTLPHSAVKIAKAWLHYAHFEIRQHNLTAARKALGQAIGKCAKPKIFRGYLDIERQLGEHDRMRMIYEKYIEHNSTTITAWMEFAKFEEELNEVERSMAILNMALDRFRDAKNHKESTSIWHAMIELAKRHDTDGSGATVRECFDSLISAGPLGAGGSAEYTEICLSYAQYEVESDTPSAADIERARHIFQSSSKLFKDAYSQLKRGQSNGDDEKTHGLQLERLQSHRALLYTAWYDFESELGTNESTADVKRKQPSRVISHRPVSQQQQNSVLEEYYTYVFPEDEQDRPALRLLEKAKQWKQNQ